MMEKPVTVYKIKHSQFHMDFHRLEDRMERDDFCFYLFVGGDSNETKQLFEHLRQLKSKKLLVIGIFRFPFRFEGKKRMQTAITQYFHMKNLCDSIIFFHGDGMLDMIPPGTTVLDAHDIFNSLEEETVRGLEEMICEPGEMNIDAQDIQTFIKDSKGPLFLHTIEDDSFDEPLKYLISAPYLPNNYSDGKQMILNIGFTRDVDMDSYRQINLRLHDMFHKADLVKLGSYFMNETGKRFKITILINGIDDPYPQPKQLKQPPKVSFKSDWLKEKWDRLIEKGIKLDISSFDKDHSIHSFDKKDNIHS
ncbi:FtsZ/tubulin family protein [Salinibacillus xinjiangensis]|uniref:Cell division protein FtsZ n=1 Tax=Salinibacillus xinjiangensis TaxID=1229268 RepID=A0A6G1X5R9_9BACI|nr:cell division protein FtsZ [Salinibacillus xinjiangensis]MRG86314.1 cell division protein FtsZ [Salinibacillus xinjiangensis]